MSDPIAVWPRTVRLDEVSRAGKGDGLTRRLVADDAARTSIAKALDLVSLQCLEANLTVRGWLDGASIEGRWTARIEQICGVGLEPFATDLEGEFQVRVVPRGSVHARDEDAELIVDLDAEDPPDVLEGELIDLGGYVVEHLALEIDPFPRAPGAVFEAPSATAETSPFAALRALKPGGAEE